MRYFKTYVDGELIFLESANSKEIVEDRAIVYCNNTNWQYEIQEISQGEVKELAQYLNNLNKEFIGSMPKLL